MGKWANFEYHVGKLLKYDQFGSNSSQPTLGSPLNLGNMLENGQFPPNEIGWYPIVYGSINFVFGLWPYHTYTHGLPKHISDIPTLR